LFAWLAVSLPSIVPAVEEGFLIPGVDFSRLDLTPGAWCRYLVIDKALDILDSTEVYVAVPSREETPQGDASWVEIRSKPYGAGAAEAEIYRILVLDAVTKASPQDTLANYVVRLLSKKGDGPLTPEDPERIRDFSLGSPSSQSLWIIEPEVKVTTPAGEFVCEKKKRAVVSEKEIPAGSIKLLEKRNDRWAVWFADGVPVFHLVRCLIERSKETRAVPDVPGIPSSGLRESETTAELLGFGYNAKSLLGNGK